MWDIPNIITETVNQFVPPHLQTSEYSISWYLKVDQSNMTLLKPLHPEDLKKILVKYCPKRAVPKSDMERFIFDSSLDSSYLDSIFDGDVDYAKEMFEIFFESTAIEFKEIEPYFANNDYGAAKSLVHKLKPSFHMVGLTRIGGLMDELERQLHDPDNNESSRLLFNKIQEMYASAESVLKRDLERMQDFLTK